MTITVNLYGLKACDTCRKARKALENAEYSVNFVDVRETPLSDNDLRRFIAEFGSTLLNRKSTTWRSLSEADREEPSDILLRRHPTLMKRPVIDGVQLTLGWDAETQKLHLG